MLRDRFEINEHISNFEKFKEQEVVSMDEVLHDIDFLKSELSNSELKNLGQTSMLFSLKNINKDFDFSICEFNELTALLSKIVYNKTITDEMRMSYYMDGIFYSILRRIKIRLNHGNVLIKQISESIKDYRKGSMNIDLDENHVLKWIRQFDLYDRLPILEETTKLLDKFYFNEQDVIDYFRKVLTNNKIFGEDIKDTLKHTQFISVQGVNSQQKELLRIIKSLVLELYEFKINTNNDKDIIKYVYLDDIMCSGATLISDLTRFSANMKNGTSLDIIYLCSHTSGQLNAKKRLLEKLETERNITSRIISKKTIKNIFVKGKEMSDDEIYDCLWPKKIVGNDIVNKYTADYVRHLKIHKSPVNRAYRVNDFKSEIYSSNKRRTTMELALFKAGCDIALGDVDKEFLLKPMGFDYLNTLGFGTFFATYLGMSKNCPIAFWSGSVDKPKSAKAKALLTHKWYPLLPI